MDSIYKSLSYYKASKLFVENNKNPIFIDLGGNLGLFTFFIARLGYVCHTFEPHPYYFSILQKRRKLIGIEQKLKFNIRLPILNNLGISNYEGEAELFLSNKVGSHSFNKEFCFEYKGVAKASITTLDKYCKGLFHKNDNLFIKIDVEGEEYKAIEGATNLIKEFQPDFFVEVRKGEFNTAEKITSFLEKFGYNVFKSKNFFAKPNQIHDDLYFSKNNDVDVNIIDSGYKQLSRLQKTFRLLNNIKCFRIADLQTKLIKMPEDPEYRFNLIK